MRPTAELLISAVLLCLLLGCSDRGSARIPSKSEATNRTPNADSKKPTSEIDRFAEQLKLAKNADRKGKSEEALKLYLSIPRDGSSMSVQAALAAAVIQYAQGQIYNAIVSNEYVLLHEPVNRTSSVNLAELYAVTGQRSKADDLLLKLSRTGRLTFEQLVLLTDFDRRHPSYADLLAEYSDVQPDDPAVNLGLATEEFSQKQLLPARTRLDSIVGAYPQLAAAQGLLGEILVDTSPADLPSWFARVPAEIRDSSEVMYACGMWCRSIKNDRMAARCFWESLRLTPASYRTMYMLGSVLTEMEVDVAQSYRAQSEAMFSIRQNLSRVLNTGGGDTVSLKAMIEQLIASGRQHEARCWLEVAKQKHPNLDWVPTLLKSIPDRSTTMSRFTPGNDLTEKHSLDHFPKFDPTAVSTLLSGVNIAHTEIRFAEQSKELGIHFQYQFGRPENSKAVRMFESTGGGIGVLDVDADGRGDLFFTQGLEWKSGEGRPLVSAKYTDVLFRNLGNTFLDITTSAGLSFDGGYGQGCSAGDINNDGFQDLYIANIGQNRLYLNNGDGTFTDHTAAVRISTDAWTTSCLIADIDGDGNPDLFDVNYLEGNRVFRDTCNDHACSTAPFDGAPDDVYWSLGDGSFEHVRRNEEGNTGPGLGIVAFQMQDSPSATLPVGVDKPVANAFLPQRKKPLALYIGNDGKPDFLLAPASLDSDNLDPGSWRNLVDSGFQRGLAVNSQGKYTSSMGIASGDLNADGKLDFFVTNYSGEPNTLHLQQPGVCFVDGISGTGLYQAGLPYIGWGTQLIDADNDAKKDIVVVNGHVANFQMPGVEYNMPTHFFRQAVNFQFVLAESESLGEFFTQKILGRALVTLDWNSDGLMDLVVGTLERPIAVLTNTTSGAGNFLTVKLHAVSTARDAVGAVVTVSTVDSTFRSELTAGDGYHASQERCLHFGLGQGAIDSATVTVEWPGGETQTLAQVPVNSILEVTESRGSLLWQHGVPVALGRTNSTEGQ